jgi:hypothetical protein
VPSRIKQFSADDLLALSRGFGLPIPWFLVPPPATEDIGLHAADADIQGHDPLLLLDAVLGTPENQGEFTKALLDYSAGVAPPPKSRRHRQNLQPADLAERGQAMVELRARALVRGSLGDLGAARDVLERLAELLGELDETEPAGTIRRDAAPAGQSARRPTARRRGAGPAKGARRT